MMETSQIYYSMSQYSNFGYSQILKHSSQINDSERARNGILVKGDINRKTSYLSHPEIVRNSFSNGITANVLGYTDVFNYSLIDGSYTPSSSASILVTEPSTSTTAKEYIDYWKIILNEFTSKEKNASIFQIDDTVSMGRSYFCCICN